ncbi:hypothetical protein OOZ58_44085 [Streptomyces tauricus]|nr:sigma factor [Streptomyces tauricus]MCW8103432.1 hypothetical protein [Streptomyces tauricus]
MALHAYVSRLLRGDRFRAEDIARESLLRYWRKYDSIGCDLIRSWLFRVARNLAIDSYRKESELPTDGEGGEGGAVTVGVQGDRLPCNPERAR